MEEICSEFEEDSALIGVGLGMSIERTQKSQACWDVLLTSKATNGLQPQTLLYKDLSEIVDSVLGNGVCSANELKKAWDSVDLNQDDAIDKYEFLVYMASAYRAADVELYKKIHFEDGEFWSSGVSFGGLPTENSNSAGSTVFNGKVGGMPLSEVFFQYQAQLLKQSKHSTTAPQRKALVSQAGVSFAPSKSPPVSANADSAVGRRRRSSAGMSSRRCSYRDLMVLTPVDAEDDVAEPSHPGHQAASMKGSSSLGLHHGARHAQGQGNRSSLYDNEVYRSVITPSQLSRSHQNGAGERSFSISGKLHSSLLPNPSAPSPASSTAGIEFQSPFKRVSAHILVTEAGGLQEADEGEYSSPLLVDPDHHDRDHMNHRSSGQTGGFLTDEGLHMEIGAETMEANDGGIDTSLDRRKAEKNARLSGIMSSLKKLGEEKQERDVRLQPHLMGSANRLMSCPPPTALASSWLSRRASSFSPQLLECLMREHQNSAAALTSSQAKRSYQVSSSNQLLAESVNMGTTSSMQGSISLLGSAAMAPRRSASSSNSNSRPSSQVSAATSPSLLDAGKNSSRHIPQRRHSRGALWFMQALAGPPSKLLALAKRKSSVLMDLAPHQAAGPTEAASLAAQDAQFQPPNRTLSNTRHHSAAPASVVAAAASQISAVVNVPGDGLEGPGAAGGGLADKVGRSKSGELHISNQPANFADDAMTPSSSPLLKVGPGRPLTPSSAFVAAAAPRRSSSQQQLRAQPTASSSLTDGQHSSILTRVVPSSVISKDSSVQNGTLSSPFSDHRRLSFATDRNGTSTTRHGNPNSDVYARKPPRSQRPQHGPHSGLLAAADRAALDEGGVHHADDNAMRAVSSPLVDFQQKSAGNDQLLYGIMTSALSSPSNDMSQGEALLKHMAAPRPKTASPGFEEKHATALLTGSESRRGSSERLLAKPLPLRRMSFIHPSPVCASAPPVSSSALPAAGGALSPTSLQQQQRLELMSESLIKVSCAPLAKSSSISNRNTSQSSPLLKLRNRSNSVAANINKQGAHDGDAMNTPPGSALADGLHDHNMSQPLDSSQMMSSGTRLLKAQGNRSCSLGGNCMVLTPTEDDEDEVRYGHDEDMDSFMAAAAAGEDGDSSMPASVQRSGTASQYPATNSLQSAAYLLSPRPPAPSTSGVGSSSSSSARSQRLLLAMTSSDLQTSHADALVSNMLTEPSPVSNNDPYQMQSRRPASSYNYYNLAPGTRASNHYNSRGGGTTPMSASSSTPRVPRPAMTGSKADEARL